MKVEGRTRRIAPRSGSWQGAGSDLAIGEPVSRHFYNQRQVTGAVLHFDLLSSPVVVVIIKVFAVLGVGARCANFLMVILGGWAAGTIVIAR